MKKVLLFEMKRSVSSKGLVWSLILSGIIILLDFICFYKYNANFETGAYITPAIEAWIGTDYKFSYNALFYVLLPILAALPYAGSYYEDLQSGYIKNICLCASRTQYYIAKYLTTFITAGIAIIIPLIINLMLCMYCFPNIRPEKLLFTTAGILDNCFMSTLFNLYPLAYMLIYTIIDGVIAGMIAVFSLCITEYMGSLFSTIVTPFTFYILSGVILQGDGECSKNWSIMEMANPLQRFQNQGWKIFLIFFLGFVLSICWFCIKGKRKDIL